MSLLSLKVTIIMSWFSLFFLAEKWRPEATPPKSIQNSKRAFKNIFLWGINTLLSPLLILPITQWGSQFYFFERPSFLMSWQGVIVDLNLLDLTLYWWHRANHEIPFLWRFHEVHHLDEFLDSTSAVRFHFGEVFLSAIFRLIIIFLFAIPFTSVLIFEIGVLLASIFHHSNLHLPNKLENFLKKFMITPAIHWMHHHPPVKDTNSNYGTFTTFWDILFQSKNPKFRYKDMPIGVNNQKDLPLLYLLLKPFYWSKRGRGLPPVSGL